MFLKIGRSMLVLGAVAQVATFVPIASPAYAQRWDDRRSEANQDRWERDRSRADRNRRDWERKRRNDAKTEGIVAGVVGTAVLAGIIAAAASSGKKDRREREDYCRDRYGNYDRATDSYRASDGRRYRCE